MITKFKGKVANNLHYFLMGLSSTERKKYNIIFPKTADYHPNLPDNLYLIGDYSKPIFIRTNTFQDVRLYSLTGMYVSFQGIVFKNFRIFTPSLIPSKWITHVTESLTTNIISFLLKQWSSNIVSIANEVNIPVAIIYEFWAAGNYYHWICDALPRLILLKNQNINCIILIPKNNRDYIRQTVEWLGFSNILEIEQDTIYHINHMILPETTSGIGYQNVPLINQVRKVLLDKFSAVHDKKSNSIRRVYSSRSSARMRRIVNEDNVTKLLLKYDFHIVNFENYSFIEQLEIMAGANILIGAHGANLTNLAFMSDHSSVVELTNKNNLNPCYYNLSSSLGVGYNYMPCEPVETSWDINNHDLIVDLKLLEETLLGIIAAQN